MAQLQRRADVQGPCRDRRQLPDGHHGDRLHRSGRPDAVRVRRSGAAGPATRTGGDWSTYWHNGKLYEADIRRGLLIWDLNDERENRARTLTGDHNPQTQLTSFEQDLGKPTIDIASPVAGSVLTKDSAVLADFSCADAETAVESCVGTVADGAPLATGQIGSTSSSR